jgi:hypothetical protein
VPIDTPQSGVFGVGLGDYEGEFGGKKPFKNTIYSNYRVSTSKYAFSYYSTINNYPG